MTLVVAKIVGGEVWMVADTAITGGNIGLRDRCFMPKIETGIAFPALVAFADGADVGVEAAIAAARAASPSSALQLLKEASYKKNVQFAYAWFENGKPKLCKIEDAAIIEMPVLHLGSDSAFELFQKNRLTDGKAPPLSLKSFMAGSTVPISREFMYDICAMLDLFPSRFEHDVGGWATPFVLTERAVYPCSYCYSTSDPLFDKIIPGSVIPHGSAEHGGYTLSYVMPAKCDEMVIFSPQLPGGWLAVRTEYGFEIKRFDGSQEIFKQSIYQQTGRRVETWVGTREIGDVRQLHIKKNKEGGVDLVIADHGGSYTFAVHNLQDEFSFLSSPKWEETMIQPPNGFTIDQKKTDEIELVFGLSKCTLSAEDLDRLLLSLAEARSKMKPEVLLQKAHGATLAQIDPAWRTLPNLHPSLSGHLLSLRHSGYGWIDFLLPLQEAANLGKWLVENSERQERS